MNNNEAVVLLAREFGWTLDDIGKLTLEQVKELVAELNYQRQLQAYTESYRFAFLASILCNLFSKKKVTVEDFIGAFPRRDGEKPSEEELLILAKRTRRQKDNG